ncbi:MAG TPA: hypothetical protein VH640_26580 [Bryobacteraceae bacterium]
MDYSNKAGDYYREHLLPKILAAQNEIESKIVVMNAADETHRRIAEELRIPFPPPGQIHGYKAATQYAYDDYRRRVFGEKDAGLDNAIRWLQSETTWDFALGALARISNPTAEAKLLEAANSKNSRLAEMAQGFLRLRKDFRAKGLLQRQSGAWGDASRYEV